MELSGELASARQGVGAVPPKASAEGQSPVRVEKPVGGDKARGDPDAHQHGEDNSQARVSFDRETGSFLYQKLEGDKIVVQIPTETEIQLRKEAVKNAEEQLGSLLDRSF